MKFACPNCGHEYDRAPETSRRTAAVEALLKLDWVWINGEWYPPRRDRRETTQFEHDRRQSALWSLLVSHSDVDTGITGDHTGVRVLLHNPKGLNLADFGPELEDIIAELARHLLEINEGIKL